MRLMDTPMGENDANAKTVGGFLKMLLVYLWAEAEQFNSKRPFGNSDWQYQVYASLIKAGYEIGELDEDGYVKEVDYAKADKLITDAIDAEFAEPVRHGRWLKTQEPLGWRDVDCAECSACHDSWIIDEDCEFDDFGGWHYCPNCGAKMDLEDEI